MASEDSVQYRYIEDTKGKEYADRWLKDIKAKELKIMGACRGSRHVPRPRHCDSIVPPTKS